MRRGCLPAHEDSHLPVTEPRRASGGGRGGRSGAESPSLKASQLLGSERGRGRAKFLLQICFLLFNYDYDYDDYY